ncbi:MAG TPA: FUSC family membrane protein, partial [Daejeonella sp.]|nr:FUSC family membrane protein [Daejeonella sp.]
MKQTREIKSFIFSQYFSDGLLITFGVLLPSLIFYHFEQIGVGITISLGALAVSIADNPGPVIHKRNGMLICNLCIFLAAILTGLINQSPILLGVEILVLCFIFSMFSVYGTRASAIGTAALLIMIISIDQKLTLFGSFQHAIYVLSGGLWYMILSLSVAQIRPYRAAQQALGECIKELAKYVRLKAAFYDVDTDYEKNYKNLIEQQVEVHRQQDSVREILFKSRMVMKDSTPTGRLLILTFVDIIDLFEQSMATFYDYQAIRNTYGKTKVLNEFQVTVNKIADELEDLSFIITSNYAVARMRDMKSDLEKLKTNIDLVEAEYGLHNLILKKILINVRNMSSRTHKIYSYFNPKTLAQQEIRSKSDLTKFVSHQNFGIKFLRNNLNMESGNFRHALRVALV